MTITLHEPLPETTVLTVCIGKIKRHGPYKEAHIYPTIVRGLTSETVVTIDGYTLVCLQRSPDSPLEFHS